MEQKLPWLLPPVAPAARGGCPDTGFLSFLPSDLSSARSTPALLRFRPLLPALLAFSLQPCPSFPSEHVSVAMGWLHVRGFQAGLTGLSLTASTA